MCVTPCRTKLLAGVRSIAAVVVYSLHRIETELVGGWLLDRSSLPSAPHPPYSVLLFVVVRWL